MTKRSKTRPRPRTAGTALTVSEAKAPTLYGSQDGTELRFRRLDSIGSADADEDGNFLPSCFVDTGDLGVLADLGNPRRLILGRTGSGKTALVKRLSGLPRTIRLEPESLALPYISNSSILSFVTHLGVKLDIFYRLLWRHVFTVEILRAHFKIRDESEKAGVLTHLKNFFRDRKHSSALEYLENWGKSFWKETDYRIRELTTKLETDLKGSIGHIGVPLTGESAKKVSEELKYELVERAQNVVNQVQIRELSEIIELLDDVIDEPHKSHTIVIDRLDENWVEEKQRYLLIRALIETVRDFRKVRHVKIVVALRRDLIERVFRLTRDAGFQEEKYESLFLELQWTKERLVEVLDRRIAHLLKPRYGGTVTHSQVLPETVGRQDVLDFITERTLMRPRDVILFFNQIIDRAVQGPGRITPEIIREAEGEYSRTRLRSLADEWSADYPNLLTAAEILKNRRSSFGLGEISDDDCLALAINLAVESEVKNDPLVHESLLLAESAMIDYDQYRRFLAQIFYRVGLVGLKLERFETTLWATNDRRNVSSAEIGSSTRVSVHPAVWRTLGITPP